MLSEDSITVGDFVHLIRGTTYQGALVGKPGPALLGLGAIVPGGGFRGTDFKTYGGECPEKLMLRPGDLFVSLKGATKSGDMIGSIARVPPEVESGRLTQDTVKLVFSTEAEPLRSFLYWLLRTPHYRDYCAGRATGSAVVALSRDDFLSYPVPPLTPEREEIVAALDLIDDKIELNRKMNATLEAMARALFRDWFVDFGPTRARAEGRPPYLSPALWPLFPDRLDAEGKPEGWEVSPLDALAEVTMGISPDGSTYNDDAQGTPLCNGPVEYGDFFLRKIKWTTAPSKLAQRGDLIICVRGSTTGRHAFADAEYCLGRGVASIRGKDDGQEFVEISLLSQMNRLLEKTTGSVFPSLSTQDIKKFGLIDPGPALRQEFCNLVRPIRAKIWANVEESRTLAQTRDLLLPRLMSGELRLAEAESLSREVA